MDIKSPSESVNEINRVDIRDDTVLHVTVAPGNEIKDKEIEIIELSDGSEENGNVEITNDILGEFSSSLLKSNVSGSHCHGMVSQSTTLYVFKFIYKILMI